MIRCNGVARAERKEIQILERRFRGAQAASLPLSAACRQQLFVLSPKFVEAISAGCRDEQASGLCSPDKDSLSI
jgi:hypothetical protein